LLRKTKLEQKTGNTIMTQESDQKKESMRKFREKMANEGKAEVRGVFLKTEQHEDAKKVLRKFDSYHKEIMLYLNSLPDLEQA
jgi:ketopantoate reductase